MSSADRWETNDFLKDKLELNPDETDDDRVIELKFSDLKMILDKVFDIEDSISDKIRGHTNEYYHNSKGGW